ncbi:uncharacterized protein LOC127869710 [Dreissena polymorpha]|nr:uncharacterized protein LOC127869710 [Dreissena polymorpha]
MQNKSRDYHLFASDFTPYRITENDFNENDYLVSYLKETRNTEICVDKFQPDINMFIENIKILIARQLIEHPDFKWMELVVPKHTDFLLKEIMSKKTTSFGLPVMLKNESKYEDCVQIMDGYEKYLQEWFTKAVGGDQLTRVRLDGAKSLQLRAHTKEERFENPCPVVVEMFHRQMDFLHSSGRDVGTLYNLKTHIQRTNVNGNVKIRFKVTQYYASQLFQEFVFSRVACVMTFHTRGGASSVMRNSTSHSEVMASAAWGLFPFPFCFSSFLLEAKTFREVSNSLSSKMLWEYLFSLKYLEKITFKQFLLFFKLDPCTELFDFFAHEDFVLLVGKAFIQEAAVEYFGMESFDSTPTRNIPEGNISRSHLPKRLQEFKKAMDGLMKLLCAPLSFDEVESQSKVPVLVSGHRTEVLVENENLTINVIHRGQLLKINEPLKMVQNQSCVKIMVGETALEGSLVKADEFQNYVLNFLQHYCVLLNLKDTIREGDIFRLNNILKLATPFFFNHSPMSECIDYVLKTEIIMPLKLGMQVRTSSFVNLKGRQAKNKAADMEKENQVKEIKDFIRGLGSNKTEQAIVKVTAAAPVIKEIVNKLDCLYRQDISA